MKEFEFLHITRLELLIMAYERLLQLWYKECKILEKKPKDPIALARKPLLWTKFQEVNEEIFDL